MVSDLGPAVQRAAEDSGPRAAVDAFFSFVCPGLWSRIAEPHKDRYRANASMLFADLAMPSYQVTGDDLARIDVPALVVAGTTSHPALRSIVRTLARSLADARYLELDCGHVTYAEQPAQFAAAVAAFARELSATTVTHGR